MYSTTRKSRSERSPPQSSSTMKRAQDQCSMRSCTRRIRRFERSDIARSPPAALRKPDTLRWPGSTTSTPECATKRHTRSPRSRTKRPSNRSSPCSRTTTPSYAPPPRRRSERSASLLSRPSSTRSSPTVLRTQHWPRSNAFPWTGVPRVSGASPPSRSRAHSKTQTCAADSARAMTPQLRCCTIRFGRVRNAALSPRFARLRDDPDAWIRQCAEFAKHALEGGAMTHTLTTKVPVVERVIFLRKVPLFEALPPQELQPIAAVAEEEDFSEGELLAVRGEPGDTLYVIIDGQVQVLGADEQELAVRGPGDVIGEMAVISSKPRAASLLATSDVRVLELHKPAFEAILRERPETALAMMRILCDLLASAAAPVD